MAHDVVGFVENRGLMTRRIDVLSLMDEKVSIHQIEEVFGPKVSKNGYRYDKNVSVEVAKSILELYKRVTRKQKVTNGQINKSFTCTEVSSLGLITPNLIGQKHIIHCDNYSAKLRETKVTNLAWQVGSGIVGEGL
jgi:hypothetical protein